MATEPRQQGVADRLGELERQVAELRERLSFLTKELQDFRSSAGRVERHYIYSPDPALFWGRFPPALPPQAEPEYPVPGWRHLVYRPHPRRHQLSVRGRNLTVRQLVGSIKANTLNPQEAAENYDLPVEAIEEALRYAEENRELLELEARQERQRLQDKGHDLGARTVPG
jgi:uncharacterized protein (DUF433 family)